MAKSGTKSIVWDYFGFECGRDGKVIDDGRATCRICRRRAMAKQGNTSNLLSHLRNYHSKLYLEVKAAMAKGSKPPPPTGMAQPTLAETVENSQKYERKGKKWKDLTEAVTYSICKDSLPIYSVEKPGFKRLLQTFDSRYEIPSRSYFSKTAIPNLYASTRAHVKHEISQVQFFSATTDMWSSIGMPPYQSYTIHFIDDEWKLQARCLQTQFLPEDHTGANLAEAMSAALESWELSTQNQVCLTTDNGANIVCAANLLSWPRLSCFGHNLHLAITNSLKEDRRCTRALGVSRKVVSAFSMSWKKRRELTKAQINLKLNQRSLVADCSTRWGSMEKMVRRILEQEEAIRVVLSADRKTTHIVPTWQDIDVLKAIHEALSPLSSLTDMLSGEEYVTVSAVLPMLTLISDELLKDEQSDTQLTKDIKRRIREDLNTRYSAVPEKTTEILKIATFLDPRFKTNYIKGTDLEDIKQVLVDEAPDIVKNDTPSATTSSSGPSTSDPPPVKKRNLGSLFKNKEQDQEQMPVLSVEQRILVELEGYEKASLLDTEEDPLQWWKVQSHSYPILSKFAKKYLAVCATSAASERLFSTSGKIVSPLRASLKPEKVDMLVFLAKNL